LVLEKMNTQQIDRYIQEQPEYAGLLQIYRTLRERQEELMSRLPPPPAKDEAWAKESWLAGRPLLNREQAGLSIDPLLFQSFAAELCPLLPDALRAEAERLLNFLRRSTSPRLAPSALGAALTTDRERCLRDLSAETGVAPETAAFVLQATLGPFYEHAARPLRPYWADHLWSKSLCPLCGSPPIISKLSEKNQRWLGCGLCQTEWAFTRTACPFCGETTPYRLRQFHAAGVRGRRVDVCDTCHRYLKTIDERELRQNAILPLEELVTVHLDILAQEQGFGNCYVSNTNP
jgi:FdhE protein